MSGFDLVEFGENRFVVFYLDCCYVYFFVVFFKKGFEMFCYLIFVVLD